MEEKVMKDCKVLALCSQKGGVGKTTSCVNLAVGLAKAGKKVLVIDNDPQGSMTASLGYHNPDELPITLATILTKIVEDELFENTLGILHHQEGIDLIPANIELSGMEVSLVNIMSRELVLKQYIERMREEYDYILIDCMPSLGMITINAFTSADSILIPVQAAYLPVKGLEQLIKTIGKVKRQINPKLEIEGILLTMVDNRTNYARDISNLLIENYGSRVRIFENSIPMSVRAAEISAEGVSIYKHDPNGKCSLFIPFCKAEYHGRHEKYYSQEAEHDSFCKDQTHVKTNAEFHEHQSYETCYGSKTAGENGIDRCIYCIYHGFFIRKPFFLLSGKSIQKENGIVHGCCQLQDNGYVIRQEGDGSNEYVGSLI